MPTLSLTHTHTQNGRGVFDVCTPYGDCYHLDCLTSTQRKPTVLNLSVNVKQPEISPRDVSKPRPVLNDELYKHVSSEETLEEKAPNSQERSLCRTDVRMVSLETILRLRFLRYVSYSLLLPLRFSHTQRSDSSSVQTSLKLQFHIPQLSRKKKDPGSSSVFTVIIFISLPHTN